MEETDDPEVVAAFPLGEANAAYNLHDLLSHEGFEVWVTHDDSGTVELLVARPLAPEARERVAALRSAHGSAFSAPLPIDRSNTVRRRSLVMLYFAVGTIAWLSLAVLLEENRPSSEAFLIAGLVVGLGALLFAVVLHARKPGAV